MIVATRELRSRRSGLALSIAMALLALAISIPQVALAQQTGAIRGTVYDLDFEIPLENVRVSVVGLTLTGTTSEDGNFIIEDVPPGSYTLSFARSGFERFVKSDVVVTAGRLTDIGRIDLSAEIFEMDELVVTATDLLESSEMGQIELRKESLATMDSISSDLFKKAGASDVGDALKNVTGVSIVGGKYATVRGMSDRYTGATLNGVRVPSADPRRRAVQVDQFPVGTVESVQVTKTFTPDLQGDFTGGGVDIVTRSTPDESFIGFSMTVENNSIATGNSEWLTYVGGGVEATGFAGDDRALPQEATQSLPKSLASIDFEANPSQEDIEASLAFDRLTQSFAPAMGVNTGEPGLNSGFSLQGGRRFRAGNHTVGLIGALTWSNKYSLYLDGANNTGVKDSPESDISILADRNDNQGFQDVLWGALLSTDWQPNDRHDVALRLIFNQAAEDTARYQLDPRSETSAEQNQTLHYTQRSVGSGQLSGGHAFPVGGWGIFSNVRLDWVGAWSYTEQDEPDVRFFRNVWNPVTGAARKPSNSVSRLNTRRIFRTGEETDSQFAPNVTVSFRRWGDTEGIFKFGAYGQLTERDYIQESWTYEFAQQGGGFSAARFCNQEKSFLLGEDEGGPGPEVLWTDIFTDEDRTGLAPREVWCNWFPDFGITEPQPTPALNQLLWVTDPLTDDVNYVGDQEISAAYAMTDLPLTRFMNFVGGARRENTTIGIIPDSDTGQVPTVVLLPSGQRVVTLVEDAEAVTEIEDSSLLPVLSLVFSPKQNMFIRTGWSRTLARPTFRELAPVATEEFIAGDEFIGNPELELTKVENWDLRWEWFRKAGEVLAFSYFYKELTEPIELISFTVFGTRTVIQPVNFPDGIVEGFEVEGRTSFDFVGVPGFAVGANYTKIDSEVTVPEEEQRSLEAFGLDEPTRRLQGQPDYLFNFNVTYDNVNTLTSFGVFYNVIGEMLLTGAARGDEGTPSVFSEPFHSLNVTVNQRFKAWPNFSLGFKAKNLLQQDRTAIYRTPDGDEALRFERASALRVAMTVGFSW